MDYHQDTIVAVSTPPGRGAASIVRLSGPEARSIAAGMLCNCTELISSAGGFSSFAACLSSFPLRAGVYVFVAPFSYTREDVVELHLPAAFPLSVMVREEAERRGARAALPGEFTRRAFLNGRIGLEEVESVLQTVSASSRQELRLAASMREGRASRQLARLVSSLRLTAEDILAGLDFPEEDIVFVEPAQAARRLREAAQTLRSYQQEQGGEPGWVRVSILGRVNTGKTTLFNALAGTRRIVSPGPGTTRDVLDAEIRLGDHRIILYDTPGLGEEGPLAAVTRAASLEAAGLSEIILLCLRADDPRPPLDLEPVFTEGRCEGAAIICTFSDCASPGAAFEAGARLLEKTGTKRLFGVCTGLREDGLAGATELREQAAEALSSGMVHASPEQPFSLAVIAGQGAELLEEAALLMERNMPEAAYHLVEKALMILDGALGRSPLETGEEVLAGIFSRFCVGK